MEETIVPSLLGQPEYRWLAAAVVFLLIEAFGLPGEGRNPASCRRKHELAGFFLLAEGNGLRCQTQLRPVNIPDPLPGLVLAG